MYVSICIRYMKEKALEQIHAAQPEEVLVDQVLWVITVPAIWVSTNTKQRQTNENM